MFLMTWAVAEGKFDIKKYTDAKRKDIELLMLHLFNKVYLNLDDSIDCHTNRYVISADKGNAMLSELAMLIEAHLLIMLIVLVI